MMNKKIKTSTSDNRKLKAKKKEIMKNEETYYSCSSSIPRVTRVAHRLQNRTVRLGMVRRRLWERKAKALAFPLGQSFAVFANLVMERKFGTGQNVDDLAEISVSTVKESLVNASCGDKIGSFATNFERSFKSTLKILTMKTKQEDTRKSFRVFISVSIMLVCIMLYGTYYVFSQKMFMESSAGWITTKQKRGINTLTCQVRVGIQMIVSLLIPVVDSYVQIRRSRKKHTITMVDTSIISFLIMILCGVLSIYYVDFFEGSDKFWLFLWIFMCLLLLANVFIVGLSYVPIARTKSSRVVPYWARLILNYGVIILLLNSPFLRSGEC